MNGARFRLFHRRVGQDIRAWPTLALLLLVVVAAIGCVLWFMQEAMQNERLAVRQTLAEAYRGHLALAQQRVVEQWSRGLARFDDAEPGPALFERAVRDGWAESAIIFGADGRIVYPRMNATDRVAEANAELLALDTAEDRSGPQHQQIAARLRARVTDYTSTALPAAQRLFLMRELQRLDPGEEFPMLAAEDLAARFLEAHPSPILPETLRPADLPDGWQVPSPGKHALALFSTAHLRDKLAALVRDPSLPGGARVAVAAPGEAALTESTLVTLALGPQLPGWRLALSLDDHALFDTAAEKKVTAYLWTGSAFIGAITVLALFLARGFGRQVRLARLKNDLVATVSHELKTPLTAMRALVDTLLDTEKFDERTTREYLQLLADENTRLSRLIDNFLTFSRLERNKFNFEFTRLQPPAIVEGAVTAMRERLQAPGCAFESTSAPNLPPILGDSDALVTALLNLLDNAWKYSGDPKRITLRTEAHNGSVRFTVQDNGIGLTASESRRIFQRFYQADQSLSRTAAGCGLGLSIARSIVAAHRGTVDVVSQPGRGSTFSIEIPAA